MPSPRRAQPWNPPTDTERHAPCEPTWTGRDPAMPTVPAPNWPNPFSPQHHSVPTLRIPQPPDVPRSRAPHDDAMAPGAGCAIACPVRLSRVQPQQRSTPSERAPHEWRVATARPWVQSVAEPTCVGVDTTVEAVPSPSWPLVLAPQHHNVPSVRVAQVCVALPGAGADHVVDAPTCVGVVAGVVVPSPNWPPELAPQHHSVPSVRVAHVCASPVTTRSHVAPTPTWVGTSRSVVSPRPSWPSRLRPQHHSVPSVRRAHAWRDEDADTVDHDAPAPIGTGESCGLPEPSPARSPQHQRSVPRRPQPTSAPTETSPQSVALPIWVGDGRTVAAAPSGIDAESSEPQHHSVESMRVAHPCDGPTATALHDVADPILTGASRRYAAVPSPNR